MHHALKILELAGYIEYVEEPDNASRMIFLITREELYQALRQDELTDNVVRAVLRSYTGLFADYVFIDETFIATRAHTTTEHVYHCLIEIGRASCRERV